MTVIFNAAPLEDAVKHFVSELRDLFNEHNISHIRFDIEVSGRVHSDLKVEFKLNDSLYGGDTQARGGRIQAVVDEFFRRKGWVAENAPLCLTYANDDATSFPNIAGSAE